MPEYKIEDLYTEYRKKVLGYVAARVRSRADAEDICSDIFEKIQRKLPDFDPSKASVGTWIFTITRNSVIDFFRRQKPQEELDENISDDAEVDESLLSRETLSELASALRGLPEELMRIVVLRYYDNKPLTEIASLMGLSYGAIKLRHQNALVLLRRALGAGEG